MKMNMDEWIRSEIGTKNKRPIPVLSFPCVSLLGVTVRELIGSHELQARGMKLVADKVPTGASLSFMDLSVESEAFGSSVRYDDHEVPTVYGRIIESEEDAEKLRVPEVGAGRTGQYVEAIRTVSGTVTDRPVFAGIIGPYSLSGRLMDVSEIMLDCYDEPDMVKTVMEKSTQFLTAYAQAFKDAGANGVVMAEPLTGLLTPELAEEFSEPYVRRIIDAVQDENFAVVYHNCGNGVVALADSIARVGAKAYHFGNSIRLRDMLERMPSDVLVMGNVDPAGQFRNGTPASVKEATKAVMADCAEFPNFVISSGCDIPPASSWDNILAFFQAAEEFYAEHA